MDKTIPSHEVLGLGTESWSIADILEQLIDSELEI